MELQFEYVQEVGVGNYPDLIHLWDNTANLLYIADGRMRSTYALTPNGEWGDREFIDDVDISIDENIESWRIDTLGGFGAIGAYRTGDIHKLVIYEYQRDISEYLNSGSIKHSIDNPISSFSLSLENPDLKDPEHPGNVALSEQNSLLSPGAKVIFEFGAGTDEAEYEMGTFFVDRSNFTLLSETASADGRNKIGKVLKDQTIDENNEYWYGLLSEHLKTLLEKSGLTNNEYIIENTDVEGWFNFSPNTTPLKVVESMLEVLPQWRIKELSDGTIVIGSEGYSGFEQNGIYTFYRSKDIFSRQITRDDAEAYNRVCVHTNNYAKAVFRDVASFQSWNLRANKTLYVQVADGLKFIDLENYADELALRLEGVGKLESFVGPIRPHLQPGDEAVIVDEKGSKSLGLITEIEHNFGKNGYYTEFTVDSGGTVGKGRLSDFISKIAVGAMSQKADIGWDDINLSRYINLSQYAEISVSSQYKSWSYPELMKDGNKYTEDGGQYQLGDGGWEPAEDDENPFFIFRFKQRCLVDKIMLWLSYDDQYQEDFLPDEYAIQYWNGAFWVDLLEVEYIDVEAEMTHEFTAIETTALRFMMTQKAENGQNWREVEIWGYM